MDAEFWLQRWQEAEQGFHEGKPNDLLVAHFHRMDLTDGARLFLPLCGKTRDIAWFLSQGYRVVGAELSQTAVTQLFDELGVTPEESSAGPLTRQSAPGIDIFVGDIFGLSKASLGPVDAIYDRAALIALPDDMRQRYTRHLRQITDTVPQFVITVEYDQSEMEGPPFSVVGTEVHAHYDPHYTVSSVVSRDIEGGLKGRCAATENAWLLTPD